MVIKCNKANKKYIYIYIYIYTISHVLTFSRSHHYALIFFRGLFFLLPLCSRSHAFTPSHSLFAFKSKKHIPLCSHFFFHFTYFFFSVSVIFFNIFFLLSSHYALTFFSISHICFLSLINIFFSSALVMLSRIHLFYFQFFISVSGGTLTDFFYLQLFPISTSTFSNHL